jgi:SRSO17 transposase
MLPTIVFPSAALKTFLDLLRLPFTKPQRRHLEEVMEGLLMTDGRKTLARISRQLVEPRDIYAVADFFRKSPWAAEVLRPPVRAYVLSLAAMR